MPRANTTDFCPQCGCTAKEQDTINPSTGGKVVFECGEQIALSQGGAIFTSYTCRTVPQLMELYEELIFYSRKAFDTLPIAPNAIRILGNLCKASAPVQLHTKPHLTHARQLRNLGFIVTPVPDRPDVVAPTAWGRHAQPYLSRRLK